MALNHAIGLGIVIIVVAACLAPANCSVENCSSRVDRADGYEKCFNDQGLHAPDVFNGYRTDASSTNDIDELPVSELYQKYGHTFCTNFSTELQEAVRCSYQIDIDCVEGVQQLLLPTPEDVARTTVVLCRNYQNIDFNCSEPRTAAVASCGVNRAGELKDLDSVAKLKCGVLRITAQCIKKEFKECGCTTARVYSDMTYDILMPATCDKDSNRVVCNATNPNMFLNDGLGNGSSTVASLFLGLVVALAILVYTGL